MKRKNIKLFRLFIIVISAFIVILLFCACGYSKEEKKYMKEIANIGEKNAVNYIIKKYGFTPNVVDIEICKAFDDTTSFPPANGYVLVFMNYDNINFKVYINGEKYNLQGTDNFQYKTITEDAKKYFTNLFKYEIYDIYLQYKENRITETTYIDSKEDNLISELYKPGDFEGFLQRHSINVRIDDVLNQDFTNLKENNLYLISLLKRYATNYGLKIVLISYKSINDYNNGYTHTYGRNGLLDFEIYNDGLYINSYITIDDKSINSNCFELQEYDDIIFCCNKQTKGNSLIITSDTIKWRELGEININKHSKVYSVNTNKSNEITVYIPIDKFFYYGNRPKVAIQHYFENQWRQYECFTKTTKDKKYIFITYYNYYNDNFDFIIF